MSLIEEVLIEYGYVGPPLGYEDKWRSILCPFHDESRPSARVNPFLGAFKCMGCGMSGNEIKLVMRKEDCGAKAAIERLKEIAPEQSEELSRPAKSKRPWERIPTKGKGARRGNNKKVRPWDM